MWTSPCSPPLIGGDGGGGESRRGSADVQQPLGSELGFASSKKGVSLAAKSVLRPSAEGRLEGGSRSGTPKQARFVGAAPGGELLLPPLPPPSQLPPLPLLSQPQQ